MTYSLDARGFEPLRVGANAYSKIRNNMIMPLILIENLRMLVARLVQPEGKIVRNHNQVIYCPVWGVYKALARVPINRIGTLQTDEGFWADLPLFISDITNDDPNIIDGLNADGIVVDMNSPIVSEIIEEWNYRIDGLATYSSPTSYLGGTSLGSMLFFSRYAVYTDEQIVPVASMSKLQKRIIAKECVQKRKVTRSLSKTKMETLEEEVYVPPNASLYQQQTISYSSVRKITETAKVLMNYFVVPAYIIEDNGTTPTVRQLRTANSQCHIIEYPKPNPGEFVAASRASKLLELGRRCAPGLASAGKSDELTAALLAMSEACKGGFFGTIAGALFPDLKPLTDVIPF